MIKWQLSKQGIRWQVSPDRTAGSSVDPSRSSIFWSYPLTNYQFGMIAGSSLFFPRIHIKYVVFMSLWPRTIRILISNWPRKRKFSQFFLNVQAGKTLSYHGHVLVTLYVQCLYSDWSKFDRLVHTENLCSILKVVYFDSWSWQSFVSTCDVFLMCFSTGCKKWNTAAIKGLLIFMAGLFIGFLVEKCVACQSRRSDFGWHRFRFSPCLIRKRSLKVSSDSGLTW